MERYRTFYKVSMHLIVYIYLLLYLTTWLRANDIILSLFYVEILIYNFQVYLWTEELAKYVSNINSYQNVNDTTVTKS